MNIVLFKEIRLNSPGLAMGTHPRKSRLGAFLHNVTKLAGQLKRSIPLHNGAFHLQHFAANGGIRQAVHNADPVFLFKRFMRVPDRSQILAELFSRYIHGFDLIIKHLHGGFAHNAGNGAFQRTNTGLARVTLNHRLHYAIAQSDRLRSQPMLSNLLGKQMTACNLELLFIRIAGNLDDLQSVQQSRRNRFNVVGRGNEHHMAQIKRKLHVVITESIILCRIQHFQHRRCRIAAKV